MGKKVVLRSITKITQEVKENEEVYTHCLQLIVDHYLKELRESKHRPDFLVKSRDAIFGNIEDIYKLHTQLLDSLRKAQTTEEFCKAFIQLVSVTTLFMYICTCNMLYISCFSGSRISSICSLLENSIPWMEDLEQFWWKLF